MKKWIARGVLVSMALAFYGCLFWGLPFWANVENPWGMILGFHAFLGGIVVAIIALAWANSNSEW